MVLPKKMTYIDLLTVPYPFEFTALQIGLSQKHEPRNVGF